MRYLIPVLFLAAPAMADTPVIERAMATPSATGWRFDVTLTHPDTGWDHYADGWRVESLSGKVLGMRALTHPHVTEQPFTRSLSGVALPSGINVVHIRARCLVDGWSNSVVAVTVN